MRVPKMVKNGLNSVLHVSASAYEDSYSKKSRTGTKPTPSLNHGKRIETILGQFRNSHARVTVPRIRMGKHQEIETLISEDALVLAEYLRNEKETWIPRIANLNWIAARHLSYSFFSILFFIPFPKLLTALAPFLRSFSTASPVLSAAFSTLFFFPGIPITSISKSIFAYLSVCDCEATKAVVRF
jgi:hypothetical protein